MSPERSKGACLDPAWQASSQPLLDLITDRNTCSHIYRQSLIPGILARLPAHCAAMQAILARLPSA